MAKGDIACPNFLNAFVYFLYMLTLLLFVIICLATYDDSFSYLLIAKSDPFVFHCDLVWSPLSHLHMAAWRHAHLQSPSGNIFSEERLIHNPAGFSIAIVLHLAVVPLWVIIRNPEISGPTIASYTPVLWLLVLGLAVLSQPPIFRLTLPRPGIVDLEGSQGFPEDDGGVCPYWDDHLPAYPADDPLARGGPLVSRDDLPQKMSGYHSGSP